MQKSRIDDNSSTEASNPSSKESRRSPQSNTSESTKLHTPHGSITHHQLETIEQHEGSTVILVMGVMGAGKSSFIQIATGDSAVTVGHNLRSGKLEHDYHMLLGHC